MRIFYCIYLYTAYKVNSLYTIDSSNMRVERTTVRLRLPIPVAILDFRLVDLHSQGTWSKIQYGVKSKLAVGTGGLSLTVAHYTGTPLLSTVWKSDSMEHDNRLPCWGQYPGTLLCC